MTSTIESQKAAAAFRAYAAEHPEWVALGLAAINEWGDGVILQHAVAMALAQAYAMGVAGNYPAAPEPEPETPPPPMRRTRPVAPAPQPVPTRIRRTR